jgi:hypothetical protein
MHTTKWQITGRPDDYSYAIGSKHRMPDVISADVIIHATFNQSDRLAIE